MADLPIAAHEFSPVSITRHFGDARIATFGVKCLRIGQRRYKVREKALAVYGPDSSIGRASRLYWEGYWFDTSSGLQR